MWFSYKTAFLILLICWCFARHSSAQQFAPAVMHFTIDDGLPSSEVHDIVQDSLGFWWLATDRGAVRFDGQSFHVYDMDDGLPNPVVLRLFLDHQNRVWFYTINKQLAYYQQGKIHLYNYNHLIENAYEPNVIESFQVLPNNTVLLNQRLDECCLISPQGQVTYQHFDSKKESWRYLMLDSLVLLRQKHLPDSASMQQMMLTWQWPNGSQKTTKVALPSQTSPSLKPAFYNGKSNHLFNSHQVYAIEDDLTIRLIFTAPHNIIRVCQLDEERIAINTISGVYIFHRTTGKTTSLLPSITTIHTMQDQHGGIWCTTFKGVYYFPPTSVFNYATKDPFISMALSTDKKVYFIEEGMLHKIVGLQVTRLQQLLVNNWAHRILPLYNNGLLLSGNFAQYYDVTNNCMVELNEVYLRKHYDDVAIHSDTLWLIEDYNLQIIAGNNPSIPTYKKKIKLQHRGQCVYRDSQGNVWIGSSSGLQKLVQEKIVNVFEQIPALNIRIADITEHNEQLYLATRGNGILIYHPETGTVKTIGKQEGLTVNQLDKIQVHHHRIWVASKGGIDCVVQQNDSIKAHHFSNHLPTREVLNFFIVNDTLWASTSKGISCLPLNNLWENQEQIRVHPKLLIDGHTHQVENRQSHHLNYQQNNLLVQWETTTYPEHGTPSFRYQLMPQQSWVYTSDPKAELRHLPWGNHQLNVEVRSEYGDWTPAFTSRFIIAQPYWASWWFYTGIVLLLVLITWWLSRRYFRQRLARRKTQQQLKELEHKALRAQMNPHFIFNALNSIQRFISENDADSSAIYLAKFAHLIRQIMENSAKSFVLLEEEIALIEQTLEIEQLRFKEKIQWHIQVDPLLLEQEVTIPAFSIQPIVENAVIHALSPKNEGGEIHIYVSMHSNSLLQCKVIDNGMGIRSTKKNQYEKHQSLGMKSINERLQLLHPQAGLTIEKTNQEGTSIVLLLPIKLQ